MRLFQKTKALLAVCSGNAQPLSAVPDEAFASEMLGKGFAVEPSEPFFYSPVDGTLESISDTCHAYTILTEDGLDVLVHIGVDTVTLGGRGFSPAVQAGRRIRAGELLARVDLELLKEKGLPTVTSVLVTNPEMLESIEYQFGKVIGGKDAVVAYRTKKKG
ncbi:MAG: PTS glucose transporter subunit IIA [Clostridia bacterium]|nr:PTS glucose transporter subunit IIA [Clostridia bacterium]